MSSPAFYAIIPANVRYCKELEPSAKLLYGEITALAQKEGYCWATNAYFAELYGVEERSVQNWLRSLRDQGFIEIELLKEGIHTTRRLWVSQEVKNMFTERKNLHPPTKKSSGRGEKNFTHINTSSTTSKNPPPPSSPTKEEEEELEKRFRERKPDSPKVKSRTAWNAAVLKQIREEAAEVQEEVDSSKKRKERVFDHRRIASQYDGVKWKGAIVAASEDCVWFSTYDSEGYRKSARSVSYAVSDQEWKRETGWTA